MAKNLELVSELYIVAYVVFALLGLGFDAYSKRWFSVTVGIGSLIAAALEFLRFLSGTVSAVGIFIAAPVSILVALYFLWPPKTVIKDTYSAIDDLRGITVWWSGTYAYDLAGVKVGYSYAMPQCPGSFRACPMVGGNAIREGQTLRRPTLTSAQASLGGMMSWMVVTQAEAAELQKEATATA